MARIATVGLIFPIINIRLKAGQSFAVWMQ